MKSREVLFHSWGLVSTRDRLELVGEAGTADGQLDLDLAVVEDLRAAQFWDLTHLDDDDWVLDIPEYGG